jgi:hypothetical protein
MSIERVGLEITIDLATLNKLVAERDLLKRQRNDADSEVIRLRRQLAGAVERLEHAETLLRELCHREGGNPPAVRRTMDDVREFVGLPRPGGQ